ncbi:MAG: hypothetical protein KQI81_08985 [Deltaproteobacteria bacterium]|nr:hypothetical protein [Deltaproteobacteria bacterium]
MGCIAKKKDGETYKLKELLDELRDIVLDAISFENNDDPVLNALINLTVEEITTKRPLFASPLEEPGFYQDYFKNWVLEGIAEKKKVSKTPELPN